MGTFQLSRKTHFFAAPQSNGLSAQGPRAKVALYLLLSILPAVPAFSEETAAPQAADSAAVSQLNIESKADRDDGFRVGLKTSASIKTNAYTWGARDHEATSSLSGDPSLGVGNYTLKGRLAGSKILKKEEEWKWAEDFQLGLSRNAWQLNRDWKIAASATLILPLTEQSKKFSLLDEGLGGGVTLDWSLERWVRGLSLRGTLGGTSYRYKTPVAFNGKSNEAWRVRSRIYASYEFVKDWSFDAMFGRTYSWSVKGTRFDRFEMDQSFSWAANDNLSVSVGHSRGGNVLRSDGNTNLAFFDERDSSFYFSLDFQI